jgi:hypothetical protein
MEFAEFVVNDMYKDLHGSEPDTKWWKETWKKASNEGQNRIYNELITALTAKRVAALWGGTKK